ncbi:MAG: PAS domain S-box protein [Promethearchaeota archaeon]
MKIDDISEDIPPRIKNHMKDILKQYDKKYRDVLNELRESEEKYRMLFKEAPILIILLDTNGKIIDCNDTIGTITGLTKKEVLGKHYKEIGIFSIEDLPKYATLFNTYLEGSDTTPIEVRIRDKNGRIHYLEAFSKLILKNDEVISIQVIAHEITQRKLAEEALEKSEEMYRNLVETMKDGVGILDNNGTIVYANKRTFEMLGYSQDEVLHHPVTDFLDEENQDILSKQLIKRKAGKIEKYELTWIRKDGSYLNTLVSPKPQFHEDGTIKGFFAVVTDITERKKTKKELERAKNEREQILNSLVEHVVLQDLLQRVLWANKSACQSVDKPLDQLVGKYCFEIWPQRREPCIGCPVFKAINTREPQENEITTPDGRIWYIHGSPVFDKNGKIIGAVETTLEITERKKAEIEQRESKEKYQMLVEKLREGVLLEDVGGFISFVNPRTAEMLGYSENELLGKHYTFLVPEEELVKIKAESAKRSEGISSTYEASLLTKDKHRIPVIITTTSIISPEGEFNGALSVFIDITERKQIEEERKKLTEKQREFMDQTAHELRTPITVIKGYTEFLLKREKNTENRNILNTIMNNVARLEELGINVSDLYRIERDKFEVFLEKMEFCNFLSAFLEPYLKLYENQIHFNKTQLNDQIFISGDPKRLNNVLNNVFDNAIRNTPHENRKINLELTFTEEKVKLIVMDNGAGIKSENIDKIFNKFVSFPTKYDITGTGIGLYIARKIINAHNGSISAYSEGEDKGTEITISLPRMHE